MRSPIWHRTLIAPQSVFLNCNCPAFGRLLKRKFVSNELPSLIEAALTSKDVDDKISRLPSSDAQTLVDVLYEARHISVHHYESTL